MLRRDWLQHAAGRSEEALFSLLLLGAACWIAVAEGPANRSALVWAGLSILLALPWIGAWRGFTGDWRPVAIAAAAR
jgi:hypothetical protein